MKYKYRIVAELDSEEDAAEIEHFQKLKDVLGTKGAMMTLIQNDMEEEK